MLDASTKQGKPTSDDELVNHGIILIFPPYVTEFKAFHNFQRFAGVIRKATHLTTRPGKRNRSPAIQETTDYKD
jgi:hypothetical protein